MSSKTITYTQDFKEKFEHEYREGKPPSEILNAMCIDHHLLGKSRKNSLVTRMKQYELRPEGCEDTRKNNPGRPRTKDLTVNEKINQLKQKVMFLEQENEFLKKNIQMDRRATWKYKQNQALNTILSKK